MAWVITDAANWSNFDNGTFESIFSGGFTTSGNTFQHNSLAFPGNTIAYAGTGSAVWRSANPGAFINMFTGKGRVNARRYTIAGRVRFFPAGSLYPSGWPSGMTVLLRFELFGQLVQYNIADFIGVWKEINIQAVCNQTTLNSASATPIRVSYQIVVGAGPSPSDPLQGSDIYFDAFSCVEEADEPPPPIVIDYTKEDVSVNGGFDGSIDIIPSGGSGSFTYAWVDGPTTQDRTGLYAGSYTITVFDTVHGTSASTTIIIDQPPALAVSYTKTDVTGPGLDDGTITLTVTGGSGSYSFDWDDGPTSQNRVGLENGIYTVIVTDDVTGESVTLSIEIGGEFALGTIFDVPMMNSLHYVVDPIITDHDDNLQTPDNTLFRNQYFPGFKKGEYYQKLIKSDKPITQFYTDFPSFSVGLYNFCTDEFIKNFTIVLKEENIGKTESFPITIRNYAGNPGKSRVLFNIGTPPIPIAVGDKFNIAANGDGFNGEYIVQDIIYDETLGYPFLVINLNYTAPGVSSAANGIFAVNTVDFNVYEFVKDLSDVPDGEYYVRLTVNDGFTTRYADSEPIDLKLTHPKTNLIEYWNIDNSYDITWTTGYKGMVRVESLLFKRLPGGERSVSRDSDFALRKLSAKKQRIFRFQTFFLPPYLHEKLGVLFDCDEIRINKVPFNTTEGYGQPDYLDRFMLANAEIAVEQVGWFDKYNSTDLGSVNDSNFLMAEDEDSFIKI